MNHPTPRRHLAAIAIAVASLSACSAAPPAEGDRPVAASQEIYVPPSTTGSVGLGSGYDVVKQESRVTCLLGDTIDTMDPQGELTLDTVLSQEDVKTLLQVEWDAGVVFKDKFTGSAKGNFARSLASNTYSLSSYFAWSGRLGYRTLKTATAKWVITPDQPAFATSCADAFAYEVTRGGRLMVLYRVDFASERDKQDFKASLNNDFSLGHVNATLTTNRERYAASASLHVEAYQEGGNPAQLAQVVPGATGDGRAVMECGMGKLESCSAFITAAAAYAGGAFATSLSLTNAADTRVHLKDWKQAWKNGDPVDYNLLPAPRVVPEAVAQARLALRGLLDAQIEFQDRVKILQNNTSFVRTNALGQRLPGFATAVARNIDLIKQAAVACYEQIDDPQNQAQIAGCADAASQTTLASNGYDPSLTLDRLDPEAGTITGWVEGISDDRSGAHLTGWACMLHEPQSIPVLFRYFGPWSFGQFPYAVLGQATANLTSDVAVAQACESTGLAYRYSFSLNPTLGLPESLGMTVPIYAYGKSPYGDFPYDWCYPERAIGNSGRFAIPSKASRAITGSIDGLLVVNGVTSLTGWACALNNPYPVDVSVYTTAGKFLTSAIADLPAEAAISAACQSAGTARRFSIPVSPFTATDGGQALTVYGMSPYGLPNSALRNSAVFRVPSPPPPPPPPPPACTGTVCDGVCTNLKTDDTNCGACGRVCDSGICSSGRCYVERCINGICP